MLEHIQFIGTYKLLKLLQKKEFIRVYLAEDQQNQMQIAIKVLDSHAELIASEISNAFLRAGHIMSRLDHPNIVHLFNLGEQTYGNSKQDRLLYLVTSYGVNGSVRRQHPQGSQVPLEIIRSYVKQIAAALYYAHTHNILHARLKPENVLLGANNEVLLSDFGFSDYPSFPALSPFELPLSSILYMAPEQFQGVTQMASDQYALAAMIYEWLSGTPPFTGSIEEVRIQHVKALPSSLKDLVPSLPSLVEDVIMTALAKDPQQRFSTVTSFANSFEQAAGHG